MLGLDSELIIKTRNSDKLSISLKFFQITDIAEIMLALMSPLHMKYCADDVSLDKTR